MKMVQLFSTVCNVQPVNKRYFIFLLNWCINCSINWYIRGRYQIFGKLVASRKFELFFVENLAPEFLMINFSFSGSA